MIVDKIENAYLYTDISQGFAKAFEVLKKEDFSKKADGRYEIDGGNLYYLVQRYQTKPMKLGKLETHKKYIDIQFVAAGEEVIGHSLLSQLNIEEPYNEAKDVVFYKVPDEINTIKLSKGMFCILFSQDGHMPCCQLAGPCEVLKVVVKVKIDD
jgi:YhcH/YjgK/YiaL family protein